MAVSFSLPSSPSDDDVDGGGASPGSTPPNTQRPPVRGLPQGAMSQRVRGFLRYYDTDGNGELDSEEYEAALRDLARSQDGEKEMTDKAIFMALKNTRLNVYLIMALAGMVVLSLVYGSKGFRDVNGSIERSAVTEVNVDGSGVAHLTDKSGREMSTRGTGDLFSAERVEVGLHGHSRVLYCIPVEAAAGMVDSINQGATARLALLGEDGALEEKILSLGNSFEDSGNALKFGDGRLDVQVLLDDDSCNVNLLDQDQDEDGEEVGEEGQGVSGGSTRGRGLAAAVVLARNREIYRRAREDIRTGGGEQQRVLTENSSALVPVIANPGAGAGSTAVRVTVIVSLYPNTDQSPAERCATLASMNGGVLKETFSSAIEGCSIELHPMSVNALRQNPNVKYLETVMQQSLLESAQVAPGHTTRGRARAMQQDMPWNLDRIDQCTDNLDGKDYTRLDAGGVRVYVLDSGVEASHPEFEGVDFPSGCQMDVTDGGNALVDTMGKGTHVAAIACGYFGVAKNCEICSVKITGTRGGDITSFLAGMEHAIKDCKKRNSDGSMCVINMSLNLYMHGQSANHAVANAVSQGIVVVVAAGDDENGDCILKPMSAPEAITVSTADKDDMWVLGNYGSCVDFYAPGTEILSAWKDAKTKIQTGSASSSAHVTGIVAGLLAKGTPSSAVRAKLKENAKLMGEHYGEETWMATSAVCNAAPTLPPGALVTNPASTVSPSPSASPTVGAVSDDVLITVKVTTDDYPESLEWHIWDFTNNEVLMEGVYYEDPQTLFLKEDYGLSTGSYQFTIDYHGSEQFTGSYTISVEDVEIASGGNFLYNDYVYFDGSECTFCLGCLKCGV
mmetsp:Transcript_14012/g.24989  ORF Transcript_14012/g.24989 Transcript_14012/m.24989 type:complete len:846 (-) Transcript_14012:242-2779(-)